MWTNCQKNKNQLFDTILMLQIWVHFLMPKRSQNLKPCTQHYNITQSKLHNPNYIIQTTQSLQAQMTQPIPANPPPPSYQQTCEQQLQELYAYYDREVQVKLQQAEQKFNYAHQNEQHYLYEGCEYKREQWQDDFRLQEYQYQPSNKKPTPYHQHCPSQTYSNPFTLPHSKSQNQLSYNSQPTALNRIPLQNLHRSPSDKSLSVNSSQSYSNSLNPANTRSVNALVSAKKNKKKIKKAPSKATSQQSFSTALSTRNKFILQHKEKQKNGDKTIEAVFFNPLASLPFEAIDIEGFHKFYKASHPEIFEKINEIKKKIGILGEKAFFKDKLNEQDLDEIFKLLGFKTSGKMGKGKSFREFRAIYNYLNTENREGPESKNWHLGQGAKMIDSTYLAQFKELMGYKESEEEKEESASKSLFGYGFGKLERKR